jgi:hypothetical protein
MTVIRVLGFLGFSSPYKYALKHCKRGPFSESEIQNLSMELRRS